MNATETPTTIERDLGRLDGRVEEMGRRLTTMDQSFAEMRRENAADHAAVVERLERIDTRIAAGLEAKADKADVGKLEGRIDGLEAERDQRVGRIQFAGWVRGVVALVIGFLSYLAGTGGHL